MNSTNLYELFSTDPVEYNKQHLKSRLALTLISLIRSKGWNQSKASECLQVSQPRVSDLMRGKVDKFSVDALLEMIFRLGFKFEYLFDIPDGTEAILEMKLKKAML
mgnify:CR=1 FL=1